MNPTRSTPENWKPVVGYETRYEVSDQGRVRTIERYVYHPGNKMPHRIQRRLMSPYTTKDGHLRLSLRGDDKKRRKHYVHVLVLEAFVEPRPAGMLGLHNDGNPQNNVPSNLRWGTHSDNLRDAVKHGTHWEAKMARCKRGHLLADWNIEPGELRRTNSRMCRSCRYAHCLGQRKPEARANPKLYADGRYIRYLQDLNISDPEFTAEIID